MPTSYFQSQLLSAAHFHSKEAAMRTGFDSLERFVEESDALTGSIQACGGGVDGTMLVSFSFLYVQQHQGKNEKVVFV